MIEINTMSIEQDKSCSYDFVEVYIAENDGPQRECGQRPTERIEFRTLGDTLVYFHTDDSVQATGFTLSYKVVECVHELEYSRNLIPNEVILEGDCSYQFVKQKTLACFDFSVSVRTESGQCPGNIEVQGPMDYRSGKNRAVKYCDSFTTLIDRDDNVIKVSGGGSEIGLGYVDIDGDRGCYRKIVVDNDHQIEDFRPPRNRRCILHFVGLTPGNSLEFSFTPVKLSGRDCRRRPIELYQANKDCSHSIQICRKLSTEVNSDEAFLMGFMTDRKSYVRVRVRQLSKKAPSSVCPGSCVDTEIVGPTAISSTTSVSTSAFEQMHEDLDVQKGKSQQYDILAITTSTNSIGC